MTRVSLLGRLAALLGVLLLMASATAALALPIESGAQATRAAAPAVDTLSLTATDVWNGHSCPVNVGISIDGVSDTTDGLGGYETELGFADGRFTVTGTESINIMLTDYLGSTGRSTSGDDQTPLLKAFDTAAATDTVKFGDYSWAAAPAPAGPVAAGTLATVTLQPSATCGAVPLSLMETQLVDINGDLIAQPTAGGVANVFSRYDMNGNGAIQSNDALQVVGNYNQPGAASCGPRYKFDVNGNGAIQSNDALAIVGKYNQPVTTACSTFP